MVIDFKTDRWPRNVEGEIAVTVAARAAIATP